MHKTVFEVPSQILKNIYIKILFTIELFKKPEQEIEAAKVRSKHRVREILDSIAAASTPPSIMTMLSHDS